MHSLPTSRRYLVLLEAFWLLIVKGDLQRGEFRWGVTKGVRRSLVLSCFRSGERCGQKVHDEQHVYGPRAHHEKDFAWILTGACTRGRWGVWYGLGKSWLV